MRTTLDLDDDLVASLMSRYPQLSKTEAIETAIRAHLESQAADRLRQLAGTREMENLSAEMRSLDRHT